MPAEGQRKVQWTTRSDAFTQASRVERHPYFIEKEPGRIVWELIEAKPGRNYPNRYRTKN